MNMIIIYKVFISRLSFLNFNNILICSWEFSIEPILKFEFMTFKKKDVLKMYFCIFSEDIDKNDYI